MLTKTNSSQTGKWYSVILALIPISVLYGFQKLSVLTFSDFALLIFLFIVVVKNKELVFDISFIPLVIYLLLQPILLFFYAKQEINWSDAIGTSWRLSFYLIAICLLARRYLLKTILLKAFRFVGTITSIYGTFQYILGTYFQVSLSPYLPFLPIVRTGIKEQQDSWIAYNWTVRARAWFSEPATFAIYLLLILMFELFVVGYKERNLKCCMLYLIGIIVSRSSTGIVGLLLICFGYIVIYCKNIINGLPKRIFILILIGLPLIVFILYRSGYMEAFLNHTFANGQGLMSQSHFVDIQTAFQEKTGLAEILFGRGMQEVTAGYLPGWFRTYYCLGIGGILVYLYGFYKIYENISKSRTIILLVFIGLNLGTEIMMGLYMLLYMSVTILAEENINKENLNDAISF